MKKLGILFSTIITVLVAIVFFSYQLMPKQQNTKQTVTIYNWGDYLDPSLIKKFERQTGYHVRYETFDSNEAMYTKLKQGGTSYDIVIPSDYMIQKLKKQHLLQPLDYQKIKGMNNLDPKTLNHPFDPENKYSIPYFFGTLGIVYNQKLLPKGVKIKHWSDLWNPKLKNSIMLFDGTREIVGMALLKQGDSLNSQKTSELQAAKKQLQTLVPNIKGIVADEMKTYLINEEASVGITFSGEAQKMTQQNSDLHYIVPPEGSNLWFDNIVIPKTMANEKGAYAFINFMLEPENAYQNAKYIGYATPNLKAQAKLPQNIRDNHVMYPTAKQFEHLAVYQVLPKKVLDEYYRIFLDFKLLNN